MKEIDERRYEEGCKEKLKGNIEKKITTTMIGALVSFEKKFGFLWRNGENVKLNENEKFFKKCWEEVRTEILNRGNNQLKAAMSEISQYTIKWNKYTVHFVVRKEQDNDR